MPEFTLHANERVRLFIKISIPQDLRSQFNMKQAQRRVLEYFESKGMRERIAKATPAIYVDGNAAQVQAATGAEVKVRDTERFTWTYHLEMSLSSEAKIEDKIISQLVETVELEQSTELLTAINRRAQAEEYRLDQEAKAQEAELKRKQEQAEVEELYRRLENATTDEEREQIRFDAILLRMKRDIDRVGIASYANQLADMYKGL